MIMKKTRLFLCSFIMFYNGLRATSLDSTTTVPSGLTLYESTQYAFSAGNYAKGFVALTGGFSVPAGGVVEFGVLQPVSGNINLNGTGGIKLTGDLTLGSNVVIQNVGLIDGQNYTIFLNGDLTIPAGMGFEILSNTVIDGQGHDIIFENGAYLWINGSAGTTLTLRNCTLHGLTAGSIYFGSSINQTLVLNEVEVHLTGNYNFSGGNLVIQNFVGMAGPGGGFTYNSIYPLTINPDSTLFLDTRTFFTYYSSANLFVLEDSSSQLYLNGCTFSLPLANGLILTKGHLIIDDKTIINGNGATSSPKNGLYFGDGTAANDLLVDIMPGAIFEADQITLHYNNVN
jgi:hypothetical protein